MRVLILSFIVLATSLAQGAILIEDGNQPLNSTPSSTTRANSQRVWLQSVKNTEFSSSYDFRAQRRAGIGFLAAGQTGLAGINLELSFTPEQAVVAGFGGGKGFQSFAFQWKRVFNARSFAPYFSVGYAHWFNSAARQKKEASDGILNRYLTDDERASGIFAKDFFAPAAGIQYYQLTGPYVGTSFFAEVMMLADMDRWIAAPTGAIGVNYYF